jgi:hypothetical protein
LPFFIGILLVALGAAGVLRFKPSVAQQQQTTSVRIQFEGEKTPEIEGAQVEGDWLVVKGEGVASINQRVLPQLLAQGVGILGIRKATTAPLAASFYMLMTALCWGTYGPLLHKGQAEMVGSRLRPFICVGISYFFVAILIPSMILLQTGESGEFSISGSFWSLAAGALGAVGALGVIMAFNSGGRPVFVMPLVFGGAPVVNTCVSMLQSRLRYGAVGAFSTQFLVSLAMVIAGAAMVLIFAPRPTHPRPSADVESEQAKLTPTEEAEAPTEQPVT